MDSERGAEGAEARPRHAAERNDRGGRPRGEPGEAMGAERPGARVRGRVEDRRDEQEVSAERPGAGPFAHVMDRRGEQARPGGRQAADVGGKMQRTHPDAARRPGNGEEMAMAPGRGSDPGEQRRPGRGRKAIMAEDDAAAARQDGDGRQEAIAEPLVGHEPEGRETGARLPGHGRRL